MNSKSYLYIFISIAVAFILFIIGFFALTPKQISDSRSQDQIPNSSSETDTSCNDDSCEISDPFSYSGNVEALPEKEGNATHILKDEDGSVLTYLFSSDDKLTMVEGMSVEVVGNLKSPIGGIPLLQVEEVRFN